MQDNNNNNNNTVPDLVKSRGAGPYDTSTAPDTDSNSAHKTLKDRAETNYNVRQASNIPYRIKDIEELQGDKITNKYQEKFNDLSKKDAKSLYEEKSSEYKRDYHRVQEEIREDYVNQLNHQAYLDNEGEMSETMRESARASAEEKFVNSTEENNKTYLMQKSALDEAAEFCRHKLINSDSDLESRDNKSTNEKSVESSEENKSETSQNKNKSEQCSDMSRINYIRELEESEMPYYYDLDP